MQVATRICLAVSAAIWPAIASAQVQTAPPPAEAAAQDAGGGIADIVVTASRREQNLQRESRQISAVGARDLAANGVSDPATFANLVPGLTIGRSGSQFQIYIRGVGDRSVNAFGDPAVAPSLDGVYIPRSFALPGLFFDLDRIEVVKGPQGTLYGRNATAGALNLITARPRAEFGGFAELEGGNYSSVRGTAALTAGLAPGVMVRVSGQAQRHGAYLTDGTYNDRLQSGRFQLQLDPTSRLSIYAGVTYAHQGGTGAAPVLLPAVDPDKRFIGAADPRSIAVFDARNPAKNLFRPGTDVYLDTNSVVVTGTVDWRPLDGVRLTLVPGYVHGQNRNRNYVPGIPYQQVQKSSQKSIEGRAASDGESRLDWVVGAFYSREDATDATTFGINRAVSITRVFPVLDDITRAVFGEGKFHVTDRLRVIGGARYTSEKKEVAGTSRTLIGAGGPPASPITGETSFHDTNYRAGVEFDAADQVMLTGTVSTGFKAGGFYGAPPPNTYKPEHLTSYEAGIRSRFLDNRLQVNVDAFYWDYSNRQESFVGIVTGGATANITTNAGSARIYGVDLSVVAAPTSDDRISGDLEYLDSKYQDFVFNTNTTAARTGCRLGPSTDPRLSVSVDCSGFQLVRAPRWSGRVSYQHNFQLGNGARLQAMAQTRFSSAYWLAPDFIAAERARGYHASDLSLTYISPSDTFEISGFVRNLENKAIYVLASESSGIDALVLATTQAPRTYGIRARARF